MSAINPSQITKLKDDNYFKWNYEVEMFLRSKGLWKNLQFKSLREYYFSKGLEVPEEIKTEAKEEKEILKTTEVSSTTKLVDKDFFRAQILWDEDDSKCIALIGLCVSERYYQIIKSYTTAYGIWEALKSEFKGFNNANKLQLKCQFYEARMIDKESLSKYVERVTLIVDKLADVGCFTDEHEVCYKILSSIPDTYRPIVLACLMVQEDKLTISFLRQQFSLEESRSFLNNSSNKSKGQIEQALTLDWKKDKKCFKCGIKGHLSSECRAPQWKIDKYKKSKENEDKKAFDYKNFKENKKKASASHVEVAFAVDLKEAKESEMNKDKWYLDSGCSQHMTNNLDYITNKINTDIQVFGSLGREINLSTIKGDTILECANDLSEDIRLKNTLLVPDLRRNLLSVRRICSSPGTKVIFEEDRFEVQHENRVVMKGQLDGTGLYSLQERENEAYVMISLNAKYVAKVNKLGRNFLKTEIEL